MSIGNTLGERYIVGYQHNRFESLTAEAVIDPLRISVAGLVSTGVDKLIGDPQFGEVSLKISGAAAALAFTTGMAKLLIDKIIPGTETGDDEQDDIRPANGSHLKLVKEGENE